MGGPLVAKALGAAAYQGTFVADPAFPAVTVDKGTHDVEFRYIPVGSYPWLFLLGILPLIALYFVTHPRGRRRLEAWVRPPSVVAGARDGGDTVVPVSTGTTGAPRAEDSELADDRRDGPVLLTDPGPLHRHEEEQQQEPHVEGEIDPASDT